MDELFQIPWFTTLLHPKVIEWDLFINRLKKSAKVPVEELKEMWSRKRSIRKSLDTIYDLSRTYNTALNMTQWRPLKSLSQKIERDADDINEIFIEADDSDESHSPSPNLADKSTDEQFLYQPIAKTESAAKVITRTRMKVSFSMLAARPRSQGGRGRRSTKLCVPSNQLQGQPRSTSL